MVNNDLYKTQLSGFYDSSYLQDKVNHFSNPPIAIIKPNYRPSNPSPMQNQLKVKNEFSFDAMGKPVNARKNQSIFETTMRSTKQDDSPFYRDHKMGSYNTKLALMDPSHSFYNERELGEKHDYTKQNLRNQTLEKDCRTRQRIGRLTNNYENTLYCRLLEDQDFTYHKNWKTPIDEFQKVRRTSVEL